MGNTVEVGIIVDLGTGEAQIKRLGDVMAKAGRRGQAGFKGVSNALAKMKSNLVPTIGLMGKLGAAFSAYQAAEIAKSFMDVASSFERTKLLLVGVEGSMATAQEKFDYLLDFATKAPFSIDALKDSFVRLKVAGIEPTEGGMQALTDAVAAFGGTSDNLKRASEAIKQMAGKGVISMEELRQQLGEHIPNAIRIMAREMGYGYKDFVDQVSKGNIEAEAGIEALFRGMEKDFSGSAERLMSGWIGLTAQMSVQWKLFQDEVMKQDIFIDVKAGVKTLLDLIKKWREDGSLVEWAKWTADATTTAFKLIIEAAYWVGKAFLGWAIIWEGLKTTFDVFQAAIFKGFSNIADRLAWLMDRIGDAYAFWGRMGEAAAARELADQLQNIGAAADQAGDAIINSVATEGVAGIQEAIDRVESLDNAVDNLTTRWQENKVAIAEAIETAEAVIPDMTIPESTIKKTEELSKKQLSIIKSMYDDMKEFGIENFEFQVMLIEQQADAYIKTLEDMKGAEELVNEWRREQYQLLAEEQYSSQHGVMEAMRDAWGLTWEEIRQGAVDAWADIGNAIASVTQAISSTITDIATGAKDAKEAAEDLLNSILATAINTLIQIGIQRILLGTIQETVVAATTAAMVAGMAAVSSAAAPAAMLVSIATAGGAPTAGATAFTAAMGEMTATVAAASATSAAAALAEGGIVTSPTVALLGEEGYDEVVIPLAPHRRDRAQALLAEVAPRIYGDSAAIGGGAGAGGAAGVNIQVAMNFNGDVRLDSSSDLDAIANELGRRVKAAMQGTMA